MVLGRVDTLWQGEQLKVCVYTQGLNVQVLAERYLPELEALKPRVLLGRLAAAPAAARHAPGAVRLTTSDLPEISGDTWGVPGGVPAVPSAPPLPPGEAGYGPPPGAPGGTDYGLNGAAFGAAAVRPRDWDLLEGGAPAARAPALPPPAPPNGPVNDLMRRLEVSLFLLRFLACESALVCLLLLAARKQHLSQHNHRRPKAPVSDLRLRLTCAALRVQLHHWFSPNEGHETSASRTLSLTLP